MSRVLELDRDRSGRRARDAHISEMARSSLISFRAWSSIESGRSPAGGSWKSALERPQSSARSTSSMTAWASLEKPMSVIQIGRCARRRRLRAPRYPDPDAPLRMAGSGSLARMLATMGVASGDGGATSAGAAVWVSAAGGAASSAARPQARLLQVSRPDWGWRLAGRQDRRRPRSDRRHRRQGRLAPKPAEAPKRRIGAPKRPRLGRRATNVHASP